MEGKERDSSAQALNGAGAETADAGSSSYQCDRRGRTSPGRVEGTPAP